MKRTFVPFAQKSVVCGVAAVAFVLTASAEDVVFQGTKNEDGAKYQQWRAVANG